MNEKKNDITWKLMRVDEIGDVISGGTPSTTNPDYWDGKIPFITPLDLSKNGGAYISNVQRYITEKGLENSSANLLPPNSLAISSRAPIGYLSLCETTFVTNQGCKSVNFNKNQSPIFHYYNFQLYVNEMKKYGVGTTFSEISKGDLCRLQVNVPEDIIIQENIAQILTTCDKVIQQTEAVIAKYKAIKQGMLHDLFTRGLDGNGKLRPTPTEAPELYKESELGLIPKEWEVKRLSECCKVPCSYGINAPAVDYDSKLPLYLRITDITEDGFYNKNGRKCVNALNSNQYSLNEDDIVFARTGATVGKTYLYNTEDGKLIYAGFLIKFSPDPNLLNSYLLKSYTETPQYWDWVNIYSQRSGQPGINGNEYASLLLPYPTIDEQNQLANRFTVIDINIKNEVNSFDKYEKIKIGLMNQLLAT